MKENELTQGLFALVDNEDYDFLNQFNWYANKHGNTYYAVRTECSNCKKTKIYIHRLIMNAKPGEEVDHLNGFGLDNRKQNLRIVTHRQNCQNRHSLKSSKFPGVCFDNYHKKFKAQIYIKGQKKNLGLFDTELEAFIAYKNAVNLIGENIIALEHIEHDI